MATGRVSSEEDIRIVTTPVDPRFPTVNQTKHCYSRYLEYHACIKQKGEDDSECEKYKRFYMSICPSAWVEKWDTQRAEGRFPGPTREAAPVLAAWI
ncbi:Cytochrome c oxidase subunit 6b-1 [Porphyridium purpureum]|uniref:Cytochrome c oxidase subunit n=1 Tax=Porphyridium purpureum TaxID=35688 RepID=A0A5J4YP07_PORPP|nr:Cytochrome c oxidase subunit 6b-1 [Porphyridium purpureum]|eukprot:POR8999..scf296_7